MATESHSSTSCLDDPNFATICSFLEKFGELCHLVPIPFAQLQEMLENTNEVPVPLVQLHIRLLRRVFKSINTGKWEKSVSKFAHMYNSQDGWEVERFGYKKSKMQTKLRILKNLLESQFDYNVKFKGEVNKLLASDLRMVPLGRDQEGHAYWYQVDAEANLRVYREDIDEETWEIVASSRDEMEQLITQLKNGEIRKGKSAEDNILEEDINGLDNVDIEPKEILLDTGKPCEDENIVEESDDNLEIDEGLPDVHDDSFDEEIPDQEEINLSLENTKSSPPNCNGHQSAVSEKEPVSNALAINSSTVITDSVMVSDVSKSIELNVSVSVTSVDKPGDKNNANVVHGESVTPVQSEDSLEPSNLPQVQCKRQSNSDNAAREVPSVQPNSSGSSNNLSNLQKLNAMVDLFSSVHLPTKPNEDLKIEVEQSPRGSRNSTTVEDASPYFTSDVKVEQVHDLSGAPSVPPHKPESLSAKNKGTVSIPSEQVLPPASVKIPVPKEGNLSEVSSHSVSPYFPKHTGGENTKLSLNQIVAELSKSDRFHTTSQRIKSEGKIPVAAANLTSAVSTAPEGIVVWKDLKKNVDPINEPKTLPVQTSTSQLNCSVLDSERSISHKSIPSIYPLDPAPMPKREDELGDTEGEKHNEKLEISDVQVSLQEESNVKQRASSAPKNNLQAPHSVEMQVVSEKGEDNHGDLNRQQIATLEGILPPVGCGEKSLKAEVVYLAHSKDQQSQDASCGVEGSLSLVDAPKSSLGSKPEQNLEPSASTKITQVNLSSVKNIEIISARPGVRTTALKASPRSEENLVEMSSGNQVLEVPARSSDEEIPVPPATTTQEVQAEEGKSFQRDKKLLSKTDNVVAHPLKIPAKSEEISKQHAGAPTISDALSQKCKKTSNNPEDLSEKSMKSPTSSDEAQANLEEALVKRELIQEMPVDSPKRDDGNSLTPEDLSIDTADSRSESAQKSSPSTSCAEELSTKAEISSLEVGLSTCADTLMETEDVTVKQTGKNSELRLTENSPAGGLESEDTSTIPTENVVEIKEIKNSKSENPSEVERISNENQMETEDHAQVMNSTIQLDTPSKFSESRCAEEADPKSTGRSAAPDVISEVVTGGCSISRNVASDVVISSEVEKLQALTPDPEVSNPVLNIQLVVETCTPESRVVSDEPASDAPLVAALMEKAAANMSEPTIQDPEPEQASSKFDINVVVPTEAAKKLSGDSVVHFPSPAPNAQCTHPDESSQAISADSIAVQSISSAAVITPEVIKNEDHTSIKVDDSTSGVENCNEFNQVGSENVNRSSASGCCTSNAESNEEIPMPTSINEVVGKVIVDAEVNRIENTESIKENPGNTFPHLQQEIQTKSSDPSIMESEFIKDSPVKLAQSSETLDGTELIDSPDTIGIMDTSEEGCEVETKIKELDKTVSMSEDISMRSPVPKEKNSAENVVTEFPLPKEIERNVVTSEGHKDCAQLVPEDLKLVNIDVAPILSQKEDTSLESGELKDVKDATSVKPEVSANPVLQTQSLPDRILPARITSENILPKEESNEQVELLEVKQEVSSVVANETETLLTTSLTDVTKDFFKADPESKWVESERIKTEEEFNKALTTTVEVELKPKPVVEFKPEPTNPKAKSKPVAFAEAPTHSLASTETGRKCANPILGLVAYGSSSEDENEENVERSTTSLPLQVSKVEEDVLFSHKRKLEGESLPEQEAKIPKMDVKGNPIVGEAIEEELMVITGSGEGAQNEGGNESPSGSPLPPDLDESLEIEHEQNSQDGLLPPKPKGRGRPRKNPPKEVLKDKNVREKSASEGKASRRSSFNNDDLNGINSSGPVRRSGRVAQIRQKEEEERRKLEEERLAQLKEAQVRKQQKQMEKEIKAAKLGNKPKEPKLPKKPKGTKVQKHVTYMPSPSETGSDSDNEPDEEYVDLSDKPGKKKRKKRSKNGKAIKRGDHPWLHSSSEEDEAVEEEEEEHVEEEEEEELIFNGSDHEFSPESDIGEESEYSPSRHARTAKQKEEAVDKYAETYCDKCGKGDHPEWILLCDSCDKGWHALCVNPQIWVIPEGEWFCPPCQHNMLVNKLSENLVEYEKQLKKRENEVLRKQRLAYVGISLNNVLPSAEKPANEKSDGENGEEEKKPKKNSRRRRLYSDDEDLEDFINDNEDGEEDSRSGSGSYESEEEPIYQLRARKATKGFSFQEYDDMIKSALRGDSPDEEEKEKLEDKPVENSNNGLPPDDKVEKKEKEAQGSNDEDDEDDDEKIGRVKKQKKPTIKDEDTDEDELDEKEKNRRKMLNQSQKKNRRRLNDLDATSEEDSDEDFKGSGISGDEEDEENVVEEDSDWSGDGDESDDSIAMAKLAARKRKRHGPLGRQERYSDAGTVRRSTRRRKSRITYDESDQDEDEEDQTEKWQSGDSENSESESESDETWGKSKKKKVQASGKSKLSNFFLQGPGGFKKSKPKKKRRRSDEDDVDRAWSNKFGNKGRKSDEPVERKTRGRQINFKDILDSGESDDDGNIRPKRRRILSDSDEDSEEPSSSRKLAEEIRAANAKQMAEEKLQHEEKLKAIANAEKQLKTNASAVTTTVPTPPTLPAPIVATVTVPPVVPPPELLPPLNSLELSKERPIKITNSIVESILLRKSPDIPDSPPSPLPLTISSPNDPIMVVPPLTGIPTGTYLPSVISSITSSIVPVTGSARVGKKKTASMLPAPASSADVLPFPSKKGNTVLSSAPLPPKPVAPGIATTSSINSNISVLPSNLASDLTRLAGPMYGNNPALRSFHPAWGRNPPPYSGPTPGGLGKPPPLNSTSFMTQPGPLRPPPSSAYGQQPPPGLRIPNPNALQAFQQFSKRTGDVGAPSYRLPPSHQLPSLPSMTRDRIFLGASSPYSSYGILPPQGQGQQHTALFAPPFEYRAPDTFKEELLERAPGQTTPSTTQVTGVVPSISVSASSGSKEEGPAGSQGDGEFGGLVSYFSSQHSNDED